MPLSTIAFELSSNVIIAVSLVVPVKFGFWLSVIKSVKLKFNVVICVTTSLALIDTFPNLSTALIR